MGARQRLNSLYLLSILIVSALIGVALQSWGLFIIGALTLIAILVHGGNIRFQSQSGSRARRRR
ncbi:hypothetical protein Enr17x_42170 [Gimesia fumaroli]|uniref:Uncharacterized protein n=1 Tax=Gimesia fumaroli TaxID=2527976 RepID=A0A518IGF9_9PLAN|nr:hypothetical protein Enr17x_42170 [Gimesia fumaroli]